MRNEAVFPMRFYFKVSRCVSIQWTAAFLLCASYSSAISQVQPSPTSNPPGGNLAGSVSLMSNREFWLSVCILTFGIVIVIIQYILVRDVIRDKTEEISRTFIVTLIIIGTLTLISSGFTSEQIAPALGLFGTIAGYLLGRAERSLLEPPPSTPPAPPPALPGPSTQSKPASRRSRKAEP